MELGELQQKLCTNAALLAHFQRNLLQRERELEEINQVEHEELRLGYVCCY